MAHSLQPLDQPRQRSRRLLAQCLFRASPVRQKLGHLRRSGRLLSRSTLPASPLGGAFCHYTLSELQGRGPLHLRSTDRNWRAPPPAVQCANRHQSRESRRGCAWRPAIGNCWSQGQSLHRQGEAGDLEMQRGFALRGPMLAPPCSRDHQMPHGFGAVGGGVFSLAGLSASPSQLGLQCHQTLVPHPTRRCPLHLRRIGTPLPIQSHLPTRDTARSWDTPSPPVSTRLLCL